MSGANSKAADGYFSKECVLTDSKEATYSVRYGTATYHYNLHSMQMLHPELAIELHYGTLADIVDHAHILNILVAI